VVVPIRRSMLSWSPPLREERARMGHPQLGDAHKPKSFSSVGLPPLLAITSHQEVTDFTDIGLPFV